VEIVRSLDEAGFSTWHFKRDCEEGRWYGDQIADAIRVAEAVVVILTRATLSSDPVHLEVALGTKLRKKFLPVVVGMREDQVEDNDFLYALSRSTWVVVPEGRLTQEIGRVARGVRALGLCPTGAKSAGVGIGPEPPLSTPAGPSQSTFPPRSTRSERAEVTPGVPSVAGLTLGEASLLLAEHGLRIDAKRFEESESVPVGRIVRQDPLPGAERVGDVIFVTVSRGTVVRVPDIVTLPVEEARRIIEDLGLRLEVVGEVDVDMVPPGRVARQSPRKDAHVGHGGSRIRVWVSR
jgi:hypothetical protein